MIHIGKVIEYIECQIYFRSIYNPGIKVEAKDMFSL